jgi:hypothetical protein
MLRTVVSEDMLTTLSNNSCSHEEQLHSLHHLQYGPTHLSLTHLLLLYTYTHSGAYNTTAAAVTAPAAVTQASRRAAARAGFDSMNGVVASLLTDLTASARFPGSLNVDLNEITTNLVPFPRLHYLISALSPLRLGGNPNPKGGLERTCVSTVFCC